MAAQARLDCIAKMRHATRVDVTVLMWFLIRVYKGIYSGTSGLQSVQIKCVSDILKSLFLNQTLCYDHSLALSWKDNANEWSQHKDQ